LKTSDPTYRPGLRIRKASVAILLLAIAAMTSGPGAPDARAQTQARPLAQQMDHPAAIREMPPQMETRFAASKAVLQPPARAWIEQQARIEGQKPAPDLAAMEAAIRARFGNRQAGAAVSHATAGAAPARGAVPVSGTFQQMGGLGEGDIAEIVFLVMMQASKDAENDLRQIMAEAKAIAAAKQKLRELINPAGREFAAAAASNGKTPASAPCNIPACRALADGAMRLSTMTAQTRHPLRYSVPGQMSYAQAQQELDKMKQDLDSMSELGETESLKLQMAMDRRSKAIEMLSNVMKKMDATSSAIVQNLK
jgi:hypothetical protein